MPGNKLLRYWFAYLEQGIHHIADGEICWVIRDAKIL